MTTTFPCRYTIVQFLPFPETGEFANVGIILASPLTGKLTFRLQTRRWGRITAFFDELKSQVYRKAVQALEVELERVQVQAVNLPADSMRPDAIRNLFESVVQPRETIFRFSTPRAILTADPGATLTELFQYYVERSFATPEYVEKTITKRLQVLLKGIALPLPFKPDRVGNDEVHATFPFVQRDGEHQVTKIIKPFNLNQDAPNDILEHGSAWVAKIRHLQRRQLIPRAVLFAVQAPNANDSKRYGAYREIRQELEDFNVTVVDQAKDQLIVDFARG